MPHLVQLNPEGHVVKSWELADQPLTIGRGDDVQIKVDDQEMSRHHCQIVAHEGRHAIEDQNSTNGTWVNGRRVTTASLRANDQIKTGQTTFVYHVGTATLLGFAERAVGKGFQTQLKDIYKEVQ